MASPPCILFWALFYVENSLVLSRGKEIPRGREDSIDYFSRTLINSVFQLPWTITFHLKINPQLPRSQKITTQIHLLIHISKFAEKKQII